MSVVCARGEGQRDRAIFVAQSGQCWFTVLDCGVPGGLPCECTRGGAVFAERVAREASRVHQHRNWCGRRIFSSVRTL